MQPDLAALARRSPAQLGGLTGLALLLVVVLPLAFAPGDMTTLAGAVNLAIVALGLDLLVGQAGQLSLAHAAFYGVGFYTAVNVGTRTAWPLAFLAAVVVTAAAATIAGLPSLRIRGMQVAIATLAFQLFAEKFLFVREDVKGNGEFFAAPTYLGTPHRQYFLVLALFVVTVLFLRRVRSTRAGRSFVAVRDVEHRVAAFGVEPGTTKLLAYGLSGGIVGLAGGFFALQQGNLSQIDDFSLQASLLLVAIVVVGGARSPIGILLGAFVVRALPLLVPADLALPLLGDVSSLIPIAFAIGLIASIVLQPEGIGGVLRQAGVGIDSRLRGRPERPSPRPRPTDPVLGAQHAAALRTVPRALRDRLPVPALLVATDVTVQYGGVRALAEVSLEVRRGEIVGLIGANGAGKSTFFNAVSGLAPVTGSISYRGRDLVGARPATRTQAGVARTFQDMGLVRADTVRENVLLAQMWLARYPAVAGIVGLFSAIPDERSLRGRADMALELFGLDHLADVPLGGLPYGTMRIVEIAAAVAAGPDLLLLDEATAGLTPDEAHQLGDRFLALRDELGLTLVVIEHHVPLIARVCDWCYCLESGRVIASGTPAAVTANPEVIVSFLGMRALEGARR